jgi:dTMP kinase
VRGAFITIEGIEGVGKTSSLAAIERYLTASGFRPRSTREPGGTAFGERLREQLLNGAHEEPVAPEAEALLMFAGRAQHLARVIVPALERGDWVVCDRFTDATFAYQGGGRGVDLGLLECLRTGVQRGLEPDLTLLLDAPVEVGRARIAARELDHFEREQSAFFERVRAAYLELADRYPERIKRIDAARPKDDVERQIETVLAPFIEEFRAR